MSSSSSSSRREDSEHSYPRRSTSSAGREPLSHPLPENMIPKVYLTPSQHAELRQFAVEKGQEVMRDGKTWARSNIPTATKQGWKITTSGPGLCHMTKKSKSRKSRFGKRKSESEDLTDLEYFSMDRAPDSINSEDTGGGVMFMSHTRLADSMDDICPPMVATTTEKLRQIARLNAGDMFLDAGNMACLESPTEEDPYWSLCIQWFAVRSPFGKLGAARECVLLEHTGSKVTTTGERMVYRFIHSIDVRPYGGQASYFGLTRSYCRAGMLLWVDPERDEHSASSSQSSGSRTGALNASQKGKLNLRGMIPNFELAKNTPDFWLGASAHTYKERPGSLSEVRDSFMSDFAQPKSVRSERKTAILGEEDWNSNTHFTIRNTNEWVRDKDRSNCSICHRKFQFPWRRRHHCRTCGEVICATCSTRDKVTIRNTNKTWSYGPDAKLEACFDESSSSSSGSHEQTTREHSTVEIWQPHGTYNNAKVGQKLNLKVIARVCRHCYDKKTILQRHRLSMQQTQFTDSMDDSVSQFPLSKQKDSYQLPILLSDDEDEDSVEPDKEREAKLRDVDVLHWARFEGTSDDFTEYLRRRPKQNSRVDSEDARETAEKGDSDSCSKSLSSDGAEVDSDEEDEAMEYRPSSARPVAQQEGGRDSMTVHRDTLSTSFQAGSSGDSLNELRALMQQQSITDRMDWMGDNSFSGRRPSKYLSEY